MEEMLTYVQRAAIACSENIIQLTVCGKLTFFESDSKDPILHSFSHFSSQASMEQLCIIN